jgi:hypothetical protein
MRIYFATITALFIAGLVSCSVGKPVDDRFAFKPPADSLLHFTLHISDSGGMPGDASIKRQWIEFSLQKVREKDSLSIMKLVIDRLRITQRGVHLATMENGSIAILPAGTYVTLSTDESEVDKYNENFFPDYYKTWTAILPKLSGDSLQVVINHSGEVQEVTGFEKIVARIAGETGIDQRTVRQYLGDYAGNESIRDLLNQLFFYLPGRKIQKGDHWVKNVTTTANAPIKQSHLITVTNFNKEEDAVQLSVKSVISAKTSQEGRQYAEGALTGSIAASYITGMPYNIYLTQQVTTHTDQYDVTRTRIIYTPRY